MEEYPPGWQRNRLSDFLQGWQHMFFNVCMMVFLAGFVVF